MASARASFYLQILSDQIWDLMGGFGSLLDWVPGVTQIELANGGRIRHLRDSAGHTFVEPLDFHDRAARHYNYSIVASPI